MLLFERFQGPEIIDIFTDASMWDQKNKSGCYGFITMYQGKEINSGVFIDNSTTSNRAEIKGVKMGIHEAIRLRRSGYTGIINLFSDSQISIFGIRDYIFNWYNNGLVLINKSGDEVKNQSEFIEIMTLIVQNNLAINFFHQKGHVNLDGSSLSKAKYTFVKSNLSSNTKIENISTDFIKYISSCNGEIDNRTRWHLKRQADLDNMSYRDAFKMVPTSDYDMYLRSYYNLLNLR